MGYRIAFVMANLGRTGGNFVLYEMMNVLAEEGYHVFLITPWTSLLWSPGKQIEHAEREQSVIYRIANFIRPMKKLATRALTRDPFMAQKFWIDRILSHWVSVDLAIATHAITAFPVYVKQEIGEISRGFFYIQGYEPDFFHGDIWKFYVAHLYRLPLHHIWNSTWLMRKIKKIAPYARGNIVYPFFPFERLPARPLKNRPKTEQVHIAVYADWRPVKGLKDAIQAIQIVEKAQPGKVHWHFWGTAKPRLPFDAHYTVHGYISRERLASFFHRVHLFLLPSRLESFPLSPVESMACGTPVLVPEVGTEDILIDNVGWTFPPGDPYAIARKILYLLNNPGALFAASEAAVQWARTFTREKSRSMLLRALVEGLQDRQKRLGPNKDQAK